MELVEFREALLEQFRFAFSADNTSDKEEFINYVSEVLVEAEVLEDAIEYLPFEGIGTRSKKIQIDGYSYNELDDYLSLYVVPSISYGSIETLTATEANKLFSRAQAFIEEATYIKEKSEESHPAYGLAIDILKKYASVRKYCIYILTDMSMSKNIQTMNNGSINGIPVEYHIWDINRLYQLAESKSGKEDIVINMLEYTESGLPCLPASKTDDYTAYLCNIPGMLLAELYNSYGGRLLEGNVRSFLQTKGKVNKGIRNTILNAPDMFFAYNNGIAATASSISLSESNGSLFITEITALQIVNGGQTTASLAMALLKDKRDGSEEKLNHIYVPMKLSVVSPEKAQELIPNISRYANSQNKVSEADLWSNHPFHIRMESISRRIVAPAVDGKQYGTHWYYERANGQYKQETYKATEAGRKRFEMQCPKSQMFTKTDLAKYMNIYRELPHVASTGGQKSFAKFAEHTAVQWEKNDARFNEDYFKTVVAMAILFKQSDKIVKTQSWYNSYKANIVAYTLAKIIQTVHTDYPEYSIDFRNIWLKQKLSSAWIHQITESSKIIYDFLIDENRPVENVTEWAKREACWDAAKKMKLTLLPEFEKELAYKSSVQAQKKDAISEQKQVTKVNTMIEVANFGLDNWKYLIEWNKTHPVLSPTDLSFVNAALDMEKGKFPSEKQCAMILKVLEKARLEGFPK